jgi:GINS complex subunit 1
LFSKIYSIAENVELSNISDSEKVSLVFYNQCFSRNRRYAFAYYEHRLSKIRDLRWDTGPVLPSHLRSKLSSHENDYFIEYNNILTDYCQEISFDLTADLQVPPPSLPLLPHLPSPQPPSDLYIEIRVLQSCGEIMTENGPVNLDAGTTHYLRR